MFFTLSVYSHGSLTLRIQALSEQIKKDSLNADLYFDRGFLYQQHLEFEEAIADYKKSESLGSKNELIHIRKAECFLTIGRIEEALLASKKYFEIDNKSAAIYKLRAQIYFRLKAYDKAVEAYNYVMVNKNDIRPEDIIEYCDITLAKEPNNFEGAIDIINQGLAKIGENTLTLQLKKLEYFKKSNQVEMAIEQFNYFILKNKRKEFWYYKKAKYLANLKKSQDAIIALKQSKMSIALLNVKSRNTRTVQALIKNIEKLEKTLII